MATLYTSVGRIKTKGHLNGLTCPVIMLGEKECMVDLQEMILWSVLSWDIVRESQLESMYREKEEQVGYRASRSFEQCLQRMKQRGLVVSGSGETEEDALYQLLSCLYVIPLFKNRMVRYKAFLRNIFVHRRSFTAAKEVLRIPKLNEEEQKVMSLAHQAQLSTAEIIKCVDKGVRDISSEEKLMDTLYGDRDTTSDNIASLARCMKSRHSVILAVANLYLRKQIIFERGDFA